MKLLTVAVPCYNSAEYMRHAVDSILVGGEDVEIIIINDGSSDETALIADEYVFHYPSIVKAIHQENGGHGRRLTPGCARLPAYILRWWTATTGWMRRLIKRCL